MTNIISDPNKSRVRHLFGAASASYDGVAALQRDIGAQLLEEHLPAKLHGTVVDVGCGTGFLTARLAACSGWEKLIALDLALPMLQVARAKLGELQTLLYLGADMERLPLQDSSIEWLVSNLAMQWSRNLPLLTVELLRVLKPGGHLAFTTFGPDTLKELKSAWAEVDAYSHINQFHHAEELAAALQAAGFERIAITKRAFVNRYTTPLALMRELKSLGAHHVAGRKPGITTRMQLLKMSEAYERLRKDGWLPATFEAFYVTAVKP